jgi:hypothetical protein
LFGEFVNGGMTLESEILQLFFQSGCELECHIQTLGGGVLLVDDIVSTLRVQDWEKPLLSKVNHGYADYPEGVLCERSEVE